MGMKVYSERYFSAWDSFQGPYEQGVWKFYGPPEQLMPVSWVSKLAAIYIEQFRLGGETLMYMKIEADTSGPIETNYRVTTYSHGSTAGFALDVGAVQLVVGLIAAAVIVIGLVFLSILWYPAIKAVGKAVPRLVDLMFWGVGGAVVLGSLYLIFGGKEAKRGR
jgi:hypothetical protein